MAIRIVPFGAFDGFSDQPIAGTNYYSQNFTPSLNGTSATFSIVNQIDSTTVSGMGLPIAFAYALSATFMQDSNGNIYKESTPGAFDFASAHTISAGGNFGLLGDQYGRLFYSAGVSRTALGMYDGSSWNDTFETSLEDALHPMDWYEDLVLFGNGNAVAVLFSDNTWNPYAFQLPSNMTIPSLKSGPRGILIGANLGTRGAIILWDGNALRSKTPWKWTEGAILSIEPYGMDWLVKTTREVLVTDGTTVKQFLGTLDDPFALSGYDADETYPNTMKVINNNFLFAVAVRANNGVTRQFGRLKPGLYSYSFITKGLAYFPVPTGNTISAQVGTIFADITNNRIIVGYNDSKLGVNYIATLSDTRPARALFISEPVGIGRIKYQRVFFGPTDKSLEAVILNVAQPEANVAPAYSSATDAFDVTLKVYDYSRQLWGHQRTNTSLTDQSMLQVDGTLQEYSIVSVGDEVTILEGVNAGQVAYISAIANQGTTTETWALDRTLTDQTENEVYLQVQPFILVNTQSINLSTQSRIYFNISGIRGKEFLLAFLFENIGPNMQPEIRTSYVVWDDLGADQT